MTYAFYQLTKSTGANLYLLAFIASDRIGVTHWQFHIELIFNAPIENLDYGKHVTPRTPERLELYLSERNPDYIVTLIETFTEPPTLDLIQQTYPELFL